MNTARIARERLDYIVPWDRTCVGDLRAWRQPLLPDPPRPAPAARTQP